MLTKYWRSHPTDLVLSVIPLFNRALAESLRLGAPQTSFVTLLTDLADNPPHFWIEEESEFLICGTERAEQQALAAGHLRDYVFRTSGMILKPKFYEKREVNVRAERERLGLRPDLPTGIVMFGGHGAPVMADIAKRVDAGSSDAQLILICGHNQKLRAKLEGMQRRRPMHVEGFTSDVACYMMLSDFFIGKPGPGSISEALQFDLPVIVERNRSTMPQERFNTDWVLENRLGLVLRDFSEIASGVEQLLKPETFTELRANARAYTNRAIFEVPTILEEIFERKMDVTAPAVAMTTNRTGTKVSGSSGLS
jgi:Glycosyltransferase family 28 C-terminal domain